MPKGIVGMVGHFNKDGNKAIVCGGQNEMRSLDTCYEYSLDADEWKEAGFKMKETRSLPASVLLNNGAFFVVGGTYTTETSEFPIEQRFGPRLPYIAVSHCLCQINQTHIFMAGGAEPATKDLAYLLNIYNAEWTKLPNLHEKRFGHICQPIKGGKEVLAIGGLGKSSVEAFSFESLSWRRVGSLPVGIGYARNAVEYGETFLIVGGLESAEDNALSDAIYEFVPSDYIWIERSEKLKKAKAGHLSLPLKSGWKRKAKVCA